MDALTFLERIDKQKPQPLYVLHGKESFLVARVRDTLRTLILGDADDGFSSSEYDGDSSSYAAVMDDLATLPMLAPRRLVTVADGDGFVSRERARLEKLFAERIKMTEFTSVLILCVETWAATTKLAKATPDGMLIVCQTPASHQLAAWCVAWCQSRYEKKLSAAAAKLLVELIGPHMGQLDQEMDKLAVYAGKAAGIETRDVDALVGGGKQEFSWRLFDVIAAGKTGEALSQLQKVFESNEDPMKVLGAFSHYLRQAARAGRLMSQGVPTSDALARVGVPPFGRQSMEQQLRHLGRARVERLYDWLLETDQGMKGGSQLTGRQLMERLVVRLART